MEMETVLEKKWISVYIQNNENAIYDTLYMILHGDMDGIGTLLATTPYHHLFKNVKFVHADYNDIDDTVYETIDYIVHHDGLTKNILFVADICPNEECVSDVVDMIKDGLIRYSNTKFCLIDHHATKINCHNPEYDIHVIKSEFAACKLVYELFHQLINVDKIEAPLLSLLIGLISRYDTFDWIDHEYNDIEYNLNTYFKNVGRYKFMLLFSRIHLDTTSPFVTVDDIENYMDEEDEDEYKRYQILAEIAENNINKAISKMDIVKTPHGICARLFNDDGINEASLRILDNHPEVDFVMGINFNYGTVSLRGRKGSTFDVSKIAQQYAGGGHKDAAGFTFSKVDFTQRMNDICQSYFIDLIGEPTK